jgi:undecaprenyl phosphate-alpha-L-ara4FN deformylase
MAVGAGRADGGGDGTAPSSGRQLVLKVDVDTLRGTQEGVPRLVEAMKRRGVGATFLFSMGPDHTGRTVKRMFRKGFLSKVSRTSAVEHYGLKTLMYGLLLPGPDIGKVAADTIRATGTAGFETGLHAWDHVTWHDEVRTADDAWTARHWTLAAERYHEIFGAWATVSGAAGWQINPMTVRLQAASGIRYASDGRGPRPYRLALDGVAVGPPQYPTTLPTFDEMLGIDGVGADNVDQHLLALTANADPALPQVFTLHAEFEGQKLLPAFERLMDGWLAQGWTLCELGAVHRQWQERILPLQPLRWGTVAGRAGELVVSD